MSKNKNKKYPGYTKNTYRCPEFTKEKTDKDPITLSLNEIIDVVNSIRKNLTSAVSSSFKQGYEKAILDISSSIYSKFNLDAISSYPYSIIKGKYFDLDSLLSNLKPVYCKITKNSEIEKLHSLLKEIENDDLEFLYFFHNCWIKKIFHVYGFNCIKDEINRLYGIDAVPDNMRSELIRLYNRRPLQKEMQDKLEFIVNTPEKYRTLVNFCYFAYNHKFINAEELGNVMNDVFNIYKEDIFTI